MVVIGDKIGMFDVPCFICSAFHNPKRKVLRIWHEEPGFARFRCARCDEHGWAREGGARSRIDPEQFETLRREAERRDRDHAERQERKANYLWRQGIPIEDSPAALRYLCDVRGLSGPFPATLRYLAPTKPNHHPAIIAAYGSLCTWEKEPGRLIVADQRVTAVQLTLLKADGSGKAAVEANKLSVGPNRGIPIVLAPANDMLGLAFTEGAEDGLSVHEATGLGVYAAGGASKLASLAGSVPGWVDFALIVADADAVGQSGAQCLKLALDQRGIRNRIVSLSALPKTGGKA
jgi:hypothetical protein